ncbi:MAG TPA: hypothetical protein VL326_38820 [Kofleriaceae bacterium]|jgi:hypothetical protein|nr:hypothetical protein [Kofleriaceae bacterium]
MKTHLFLLAALAGCGTITNSPDITPDAAAPSPDASDAPATDDALPEPVRVDWVHGLANAGADRIDGVAIAPNGTVIALVRFAGTMTIDGTSFTSGSNGAATNLLVARLDAHGALLNAFAFGGAGTFAGAGLVRDGSDNVYVAGEFSGAADFGNGQQRTSAGSNDGFVARFGPTGTLSWVTAFGSTSSDAVHGIVVTQDNNIAIAGAFAGSITLGTTTLTSSGSSDAVIAKLRASNGSVLWAIRDGATAADSAYQIASDPGGALVVAGRFTGPSTIGGVQLPGAGSTDTFVAKYALVDGTPAWAVGCGGVGSDTPSDLIVRDDHSIVLAGAFTGSMQLPDSSTVIGAGGVDAFVLGLSSSGAKLFASAFGGPDNEHTKVELAETSGGTLALALGVGIAGATVAGTHVGGAGGFDVAVAGLDATAHASWVRAYGGVADDRFTALDGADDTLVLAVLTASAQLTLGDAAYAGAGGDDGVLVRVTDIP